MGFAGERAIAVVTTTLRVLRASPRVPPLLGGQEIHVEELSRSLARMDVEQTLLFADGAPRIPGVHASRLRVPDIPSSILRDAAFGTRLAMYRSDRQDVVHTHGDAPVARGGAIAARRLGAAHVHTFHGDLVQAGARAVILEALLPRQSWYLAVSKGIAGSLTRAGVDPEKIQVRTSGVRTGFFRAASPERRPDAVVGGRLIPEKRVLDLARAWADADTGRSRLVVFGAGPQADALQRLSERTESMVWLGQLDAHGLSELLITSAVGIVMGRPSSATQSNEGTPTFALEMLATGCYPLVGATTGEAPEVIRDFEFGEVCDELPAPQRIAELCRDRSRAGLEPDRARVRDLARSRFGWETVAAGVKDLYEHVIRVDGHGRDD